jgi:hypothetical protein
MGFAPVAFIAVVSQLLACSSGDTVVAANLLSSNDTQYNGDTRTGSLGGLLDPGIPENILHPDVPGAPRTLHKATKVRITISQSAALSVTRDVVPVAVTFDADVPDAAGMPVLDDMQKVKRATHSAIGASYERFTLSSSWNDGPTQVAAAALDDAGQAFFNAVPVTINLKKDQATAAFLDFKIPSPPPPTPDAGADAGAVDGPAPGDAASGDRTSGADGETGG